ncbi:hypothetical protein Bca4012_056868 [Brassica carinata]
MKKTTNSLKTDTVKLINTATTCLRKTKEKLDEEDDELVKDGHRETHEYGDNGSPRERR